MLTLDRQSLGDLDHDFLRAALEDVLNNQADTEPEYVFVFAPTHPVLEALPFAAVPDNTFRGTLTVDGFRRDYDALGYLTGAGQHVYSGKQRAEHLMNALNFVYRASVLSGVGPTLKTSHAVCLVRTGPGRYTNLNFYR